jgi:hypothetical protein
MLWNFVNATRGRFLAHAIEMVERAVAFSDGKASLNGLHHVSLGQHRCFLQRVAQRKLRGYGGGKGASGPVCVFALHPVPANYDNLGAIK